MNLLRKLTTVNSKMLNQCHCDSSKRFENDFLRSGIEKKIDPSKTTWNIERSPLKYTNEIMTMYNTIRHSFLGRRDEPFV